MDCRLYDTKLANHQLFKDLKESLKEDSGDKLRNLFALKDDVLYAWNSIENCLFCINLKRLEDHDEEIPYQKLHLLSPPAFTVEHIVSSECGSRLCLWGSRGVTVAELPSRWGRDGLFESGSQTILCKSYSLDERFLYSQGEIHRVHWHPKSLSHLLVLVSDNTMRLYNIALKNGPKLVKIFTIGPKPSGSLGQTVLDSLGDTAIDFTPTPDAEHLLILSGNGDVYMLQCNLDNNGLQAKLKGPLPMYPPADDNYGSESCAITALGGIDTPTLVVIASASAALYHCLLLPNSSDEQDDSHALYVVESVELNVTLDDDSAMQYMCPMQLYPAGRSTYACVHAGGLHCVALPVLERLAEYALADEGECEWQVRSLCVRASVARHVLRSRAPRGLALRRAAPAALLLLTHAADLLARTIEPYNLEEQLFRAVQMRNPALEEDEINSMIKERQKLSFMTIIQEVLERKVSQPILKLDKKEEPSPKECLELLTQSTVRLRGEYMSRQQRASDVIARKLTALRALQQQQQHWRRDLLVEVENLRLNSAVLREKRDLAEKHQEDLKYRCSAAVRALRSGGVSAEERRAVGELLQHQRAAAALALRLHALAQRAAQRDLQLKKCQEEYKKKDTVLGKSHSDTISSILQQQTTQISKIIEETKLLKDQLGVV
ncbi:nuclear pore complex protein Nup88 isoform X1 [Vanessa atalanta]|uniref:nuclear pore complex protein Nup88 isoform X1 n=1 Tax=Vanessa atalanta TaxID=42275 RepID=UPI001FCCE295|nr:nuclear pore complex protein Nup88 isoform X1 [Vanessa atalanta]